MRERVCCWRSRFACRRDGLSRVSFSPRRIFCVPGSTLAGEEEERVCALNVRYAASGRTSEVLPQIFSRCALEQKSAPNGLRHSVMLVGLLCCSAHAKQQRKKRADPRDACPKPFALVFQLWHPAKISHRVKHHAGQSNHSQSNRQGTFLPSIQSQSRDLLHLTESNKDLLSKMVAAKKHVPIVKKRTS